MLSGLASKEYQSRRVCPVEMVCDERTTVAIFFRDVHELALVGMGRCVMLLFSGCFFWV